MRQSRFRSLTTRILLSAFVMGVLAEGAARLVAAVRFRPTAGVPATTLAAYDERDWASVAQSRRDHKRVKFEPHPFLCYRPRPNQTLDTFTTNALGLRGPLPTGKRLTVMLLGGSVVFGTEALNDASTIAGYLADELGADVLNGGVLGYTSTQERILYAEPAFASVDIVISFGGSNDLYAASRDWPAGYPAFFERYRALIEHPLMMSLDGVMRQSYLYTGLTRRGGVWAARQHPPPGFSDAIALYASNMEHIRLLATSRGALFLPCLQPDLIVDHKPLTASERLILERELAWGYPLTDPARWFRDAYAELRTVPGVIDLTDVFSHDTAAIYTDTVHVGDRGLRRVAERLAASIRHYTAFTPDADSPD